MGGKAESYFREEFGISLGSQFELKIWVIGSSENLG
jgi:hypothetical protein